MTRFVEAASNFGSDGPFFRLILEGLDGWADGEDFFDLLADEVVFEYVISVPGYPRRVEGRQGVIDLYRGYDDYMSVRAADHLRVYRDLEASVVVLEYEVHGVSVLTGRPYDNRFVSIVTVEDGKVTHWRDYLDPVAVFDAAGWPESPCARRGCLGDWPGGGRGHRSRWSGPGFYEVGDPPGRVTPSVRAGGSVSDRAAPPV